MTSTPALTKRAAQTKLRKLGVTLVEPFDIDDLCSQVSRARGAAR